MRRTLFSVTFALSAGAAALVACTADDNTQPGTFTNKDASLAADTSTPTDGNVAADTSTPIDSPIGDDDSSTPTDAPADSPVVDSGTDSADAADPCPIPTDGGDAGYVTLQADWSFNVSSTTLNDGGGQLLSIHRCDSIQWTNVNANTPHSVQPNNAGDFTGTAVQSSGAYTPVQFKAEGTIGYHCGVHGIGAMRGSVTVLP